MIDQFRAWTALQAGPDIRLPKWTFEFIITFTRCVSPGLSAGRSDSLESRGLIAGRSLLTCASRQGREAWRGTTPEVELRVSPLSADG